MGNAAKLLFDHLHLQRSLEQPVINSIEFASYTKTEGNYLSINSLICPIISRVPLFPGSNIRLVSIEYT